MLESSGQSPGWRSGLSCSALQPRGRRRPWSSPAEFANYRAFVEGFSQGYGDTKVLLATIPDFPTALKAELARAKIVVAVGPEAAKALMAERPTVPVLLAFASLEPAPGVKALAVPVVVPPAAQVATLKKALPSIRDVPRQPRLGVLFDPSISEKLVAECDAAATAAGFSLVKVEVRQRSDVAGAARDLLTRVQALWLLPDTTVVTTESFRTLMHLSIANKVPLVGFSESMAKAGAVLAIQPNFAELGKSAGQAARKMGDGAALTFKAPEPLVFLNAKAATMLEIELPEPVKAGAAKVYE